MRLTLIIGVMAVCSGCERKPIDVGLGVYWPTNGGNSRITIYRLNTIRDDIAYNSERGIYIITDSKTGKEYVGVSGIGISELGTHSMGKTWANDER